MEYLKIWTSFRESISPLNDAEKGRLFDAMLLYAETGELPDLKGNERYIWPTAKQAIDRAAQKAETLRQNGNKGGRPPKQAETNENPEKTNESKENQTEANGSCLFDKEKDKEKEKINNKVSKETYMREFDVFWAAYPRHTDKQAAFKAFVKLKPDDALMQVILAGIEKQKQSAQWTKDGGQFIPHPATWLNGCRWEDELPKNVPKWANDAFHDYTQREYKPGELDAIGDDLMEEARKYRGHTA
jgi:hypothetical protein